MPTYEYECKSCGHNFEVFQAMSEEPLKICPQCGKEVRRLIFGGAGVIFKGSGFYVTDKAATPAAIPAATPGKASAAAVPAAGKAPAKAGEPGSKTADTSSAAQSPPAASA